MNHSERRCLLGFYENELTNHLLFYWMKRCEDKVNGGFFNCFDNTGSHLMSEDKYIWSQGRFVWIFASLAMLKADTFTFAQKDEFGRLARQGRDFLFKHCLIGSDDWRCVYLTDREGNHKYADGCDVLDSSIYADCFVVNAFAKIALLDRDMASWEFAKTLYASICGRLEANRYETLPYPMEHQYRAHGIPMIMSNVIKELYDTAKVLEPSLCERLKKELVDAVADTIEHFVDENNMMREVIMADNTFVHNLFGTHINPGHTIENMWFILDAMDIVEDLKTGDLLEKVCGITLQALDAGWDKEYGGIFHYSTIHGGPMAGDAGALEEEPVMQYARRNCDGKIWWVHSEALYTTLRLFMLTGKTEFWDWYRRIEDYVFSRFPNPDTEVREWIQTLDRYGNPKKEAVGLPVKDPYHIMRNVLLTVELLSAQECAVQES